MPSPSCVLRMAGCLALAAALAGCGSDPETADRPDSAVATTSSPTPSTDAPTDDSTEDSTDDSETAESAAESPFGEGPVADGLEARNLRSVESVSMPRGWTSTGMDSVALVGASSPDYGFTEIVVMSAGREESRSTQGAAERFLEVYGPDFTDVERLDPVVVDGQELFRLRAASLSLDVEVLGQARDGFLTYFAFYFNSEILPKGFQEDTVAQVMRSVSFG